MNKLIDANPDLEGEDFLTLDEIEQLIEEEETDERPCIMDVERELYKRIPNDKLKSRNQGGTKITYIPHYHAVMLFTGATKGFWDYEITQTKEEAGYIHVTVEVVVHAQEGEFRRQGQGVEKLPYKGYGDPFTSAESMALRRAMLRFGLGNHLYAKPIK